MNANDQQRRLTDAAFNRMSEKLNAAAYAGMPIDAYMREAVTAMFAVAAEYIASASRKTTNENHTNKHADWD